MKKFIARLVDVLSTLEARPKKGRAWEFDSFPPTLTSFPKISVRYLTESAKHFQQAGWFLWDALRYAGHTLKNLAISFVLRLWFSIVAVLRLDRKNVVKGKSVDL